MEKLKERLKEIINEQASHPWHDFLNARARAIHWMKIERKYSDEQIAEALSMDERQVRQIREFYERTLELS
jgi:Uri superfamily endonuclease